MEDHVLIRTMREAARLCEEAAGRCHVRSEDHNRYLQEAAVIRRSIAAFESGRAKSPAYDSPVLSYVDRYRPGHANPTIDALRALQRALHRRDGCRELDGPAPLIRADQPHQVPGAGPDE